MTVTVLNAYDNQAENMHVAIELMEVSDMLRLVSGSSGVGR